MKDQLRASSLVACTDVTMKEDNGFDSVEPAGSGAWDTLKTAAKSERAHTFF